MEIRKLSMENLTREQFEQIMDIEQHCGFVPYSPQVLMDCIVNEDTYACLDGETVAGFITIEPHSQKLGGELYIVNLNVARAYYRRGIGQRLLLTACCAYVNSRPGSSVFLDVAKDNVPAMNLYRKLGFTVTDIPSRNGEDDVVMVAALDQLSGFQ